MRLANDNHLGFILPNTPQPRICLKVSAFRTSGPIFQLLASSGTDNKVGTAGLAEADRGSSKPEFDHTAVFECRAEFGHRALADKQVF